MYQADNARYETMKYRRCGKSGLLFPVISLGFWQNFGGINEFETCRETVRKAFDNGITHFDLANNYGPPYGSGEETFGRIMEKDLRPYRDEMLISSKAGYDMWPGPYGNWGSKKYLTASLDQSLKRLKLDYVDIFYHHRPDPETPMEETMDALAQIVRQGKALYVGVSNYSAQETKRASAILKEMGVHLLVHQPSYSMFDRWVEDGLYDVLREEGMGAVCFSPLAQGLLTKKYFDGITAGSRAARGTFHRQDSLITEENIEKAKKLNELAEERGQALSQMALAWIMAREESVSVISGARNWEQLRENIGFMEKMDFMEDERKRIDEILKQA